MEKVRDRHGVAWYNDSKATNVGAAARSVQSFPGPVVLILGGRDKGGAFADLAPLVRQNVTLLILMGEAREVIAAQLEVRVPIVMASDMSEAVRAADAAATRGTVVLLAPACASFDQYAGYEARGDDFRARVNALPGHGAAAPERPVKGC
jgi:UDP-N-acetylmuramoylalanine--D-glutamate ligase